MKLLVSLFIIAVITALVYLCISKPKNHQKTQKHASYNWKALTASGVVAFLLLGFVANTMYKDASGPDMQCTTAHTAAPRPPASSDSAMDYFSEGNYDYDTGDCIKAIADYSESIKLNPNYPQIYNNRAYTLMRLRNYHAALLDLNKALALNPNYIQALMNRGDIHNYYYAVDRRSAIADYEKVIALRGTHGTSVCGHLFMALHNGWNIGTILDLPRIVFSACH
ncbi:MAG TPA: tetratricopeptide repeat protein [Patescibacteria group bacterium]|nr:tetratricopeptide repeat protein [Patescibacteria group bacterium]